MIKLLIYITKIFGFFLISETLYCKDNVKGRIQLERKKRAAAFLSSLKTVPAAPIEHHNTLASAMVIMIFSLH